MFKISKNFHNIVSITIITKNLIRKQVDNIFIIPGVSYYRNIYSLKESLIFENDNSSIEIVFTSDVDLEKFFLQLMREIKIDKIINK